MQLDRRSVRVCDKEEPRSRGQFDRAQGLDSVSDQPVVGRLDVRDRQSDFGTAELNRVVRVEGVVRRSPRVRAEELELDVADPQPNPPPILVGIIEQALKSEQVAVEFERGLEVELVQVVDGTSPARDHLDRFGEGFNHVRYRVVDLHATQRAMEEDGWVTVFSGDARDISFCFLEPPSGLVATIIELIQGQPID